MATKTKTGPKAAGAQLSDKYLAAATAALLAYETFEANVVKSGDAWPEQTNGLPVWTEELLTEFLECQRLRNVALDILKKA